MDNRNYTDNDELNAILKRSEQDLAVFEEIDAQRQQQETEYHRRRGLRSTRKLSRLIQEDELPSDFLNTVSIIEEDVSSSVGYGRNQRRRFSNEIQYDDTLTEEEWLNKLEVHWYAILYKDISDRVFTFRRSIRNKWRMATNQQRERASDVDHHPK